MSSNMWFVFSLIVELTNILLCYTQVLQAKIDNPKRKLVVAYVGIVLCGFINIVCNLQIPEQAIGMTYCCLIPLYLMKSNKVKWVIMYPCSFMIESIVNIFVSFFVAMCVDVPQAELTTFNGVDVLCNMFFSVMVGGLFIYRKVRKSGRLTNIYLNSKIIFSVTAGTIIFCLIIGLIQFFGIEYDIPAIQTNLLGLVLSSACIIFFIFFLWLSSSIHNNEMYQKEKDMMNVHLLEQEKYIELVVAKDQEMRRFRHDIKEHMWIISECSKNGQYVQLNEYIDQIYGKINDFTTESYTGVISLDAVIYEKQRVAEAEGIRFSWKINKKSIPERLDIFDLCTVFVNIFNNAIEACRDLEEDKKSIDILLKVDDDRLYIRQSNRINQIVMFDDDGTPISTKNDKKNHGFGSKNIKAVANKYDGYVEYKVQDDKFILEVLI